MRGASRASLAEAKERLAAAAAGGQASELGDELFAVTTLLDSQPALLRSLSDSARDAQARTDLLVSLLGGKVSQAALEGLKGLVSSRWSARRDRAAGGARLCRGRRRRRQAGRP